MQPPLSLSTLAVLLALSLTACAEAAAPSPARVWSSANSNEGYAVCPADMTVTGGGFEIKSTAIAPGKPAPVVVASKPDHNGWRVECFDADGVSNGCRAWAVCASVLAR